MALSMGYSGDTRQNPTQLQPSSYHGLTSTQSPVFHSMNADQPGQIDIFCQSRHPYVAFAGTEPIYLDRAPVQLSHLPFVAFPPTQLQTQLHGYNGLNGRLQLINGSVVQPIPVHLSQYELQRQCFDPRVTISNIQTIEPRSVYQCYSFKVSDEHDHRSKSPNVTTAISDQSDIKANKSLDSAHMSNSFQVNGRSILSMTLPSSETHNIRYISAARRSRKGCLTCRHRKKRCCEKKPSCDECSRLGLDCEWPNPGSENKNKTKLEREAEGYYYHDIFGKIKIQRAVVSSRVR
ncbi:hypothetical protein WICPIJ_005434 [Wickerhamomyces pijperi]|uniref:Zn(2)-C6 fungal-type domain-containing protein n=1 Tax=Wickerhamomyces pijperi TaxID=599730 RepID=A0A9P8Q420_WICPI|nr:hypothetical protein WICPIJ_005434 [Wickerhamomyces pijperi]